MKNTISNILIFISIIATILYSSYSSLMYFGMHDFYYYNSNYSNIILQFMCYSFFHGSVFHLLFNSIFLFYFGNKVEEELGIKRYIIFFILTTIIIGISLIFLSKGITIGISGFGLSLLTYYTLILKRKRDDEYKGGITAIIINVLMGLSIGISFVGHIFGVISGVLFFYIIHFLHQDAQ